MNIIGIAACTAGIAHTYIAKEKIEKAAEKAGHSIHMETQGTVGTKESIPEQRLKNADVVIIAADVKVSGRERFEGMNVIEVPTDTVIKAPNKLIKRIEELAREANSTKSN